MAKGIRRPPTESRPQTENDFSDLHFSPNVLASIVRTRLEQLEAITLPTDLHRLDVIHAIQAIPSFERKLACCLDYLIDYTGNLNLELERTQEELAQAKLQLAVMKRKEKSPAIEAHRTEKAYRRKNQSDSDEACSDTSGIAKQLGEIGSELDYFGVDLRRKLGRSKRVL
jgi:hypothetical protein